MAFRSCYFDDNVFHLFGDIYFHTTLYETKTKFCAVMLALILLTCD